MSSLSGQKVKVFLIDDHPVVREGISMLLTQTGFIVSGEADTCDSALEGILRHKPDLLILDISLRNSNGFDLLEMLAQKGNQTPSLVYSMHEDPNTIEKALRAGAKGYVTKRELPRTIVRAIGEIMEGRTFLGQTATTALIHHDSPDKGNKRALHLLSERERDIYSHLADGYRTSEIAGRLNMSTSTVESYYQRMKIKLSIGSVGDLRRMAIREAKERKAPWEDPE
jgi:DNA-binding NarL/FixJ family response regulator